jgi:hypothetical protein
MGQIKMNTHVTLLRCRYEVIIGSRIFGLNPLSQILIWYI